MECLQKEMESVGGCDRQAEDTEGETVGGPAAPGEKERTDVIRNVIRSVTCCCIRFFCEASQNLAGPKELLFFLSRQQHMNIQSYSRHKGAMHIKLEKPALQLRSGCKCGRPRRTMNSVAGGKQLLHLRVAESGDSREPLLLSNGFVLAFLVYFYILNCQRHCDTVPQPGQLSLTTVFHIPFPKEKNKNE